MDSATKRAMQVMAKLALDQKSNKAGPTSSWDLAKHYCKGRRFFQVTCNQLKENGWIVARLGPGGGYLLSQTARKNGPTVLVREMCPEESKWALPLMLKQSPKTFDQFEPELHDD